jgi:hypothetical protein
MFQNSWLIDVHVSGIGLQWLVHCFILKKKTVVFKPAVKNKSLKFICICRELFGLVEILLLSLWIFSGKITFCYSACTDSGLWFWLIIFDCFHLSKMYLNLQSFMVSWMTDYMNWKYSAHLTLIAFILIKFKFMSCRFMISCICVYDLVILEVAAHVKLNANVCLETS